MAELMLAAPEVPFLVRWQARLDLADHLIDLVTAAILLRHPHAGVLGKLSSTRFYTHKTDRVLLRGVERLEAFVFDQAQLGNVLPRWHRCYVAPPGSSE